MKRTRNQGTNSDSASYIKPQSISVSVVILTKNEAHNLPDCLASAAASSDVVVLDSHSTDGSAEIAEAFPGVRLLQRPFDVEHKQRNFSLKSIEYKNRWLYICDADERIPPDLWREMASIANDPDCSHSAYRIRYKNHFMGRWLRHSNNYPVWLIRFVRPDQVRYEVRQTNVYPQVDGTSGNLESHFIHYPFNSGIRRWLDKHNFYSSGEATEAVEVRRGPRPTLKQLRSGDRIARRRATKNLSFFFPARGILRFLNDYIWRRGFLDGIPGLQYCLMIAMYEYWIEIKIRERESDWVKQTVKLQNQLLADPKS